MKLYRLYRWMLLVELKRVLHKHTESLPYTIILPHLKHLIASLAPIEHPVHIIELALIYVICLYKINAVVTLFRYDEFLAIASNAGLGC